MNHLILIKKSIRARIIVTNNLKKDKQKILKSIEKNNIIAKKEKHRINKLK